MASPADIGAGPWRRTRKRIAQGPAGESPGHGRDRHKCSSPRHLHRRRRLLLHRQVEEGDLLAEGERSDGGDHRRRVDAGHLALRVQEAPDFAARVTAAGFEPAALVRAVAALAYCEKAALLDLALQAQAPAAAAVEAARTPGGGAAAGSAAAAPPASTAGGAVDAPPPARRDRTGAPLRRDRSRVRGCSPFGPGGSCVKVTRWGGPVEAEDRDDPLCIAEQQRLAPPAQPIPNASNGSAGARRCPLVGPLCAYPR